MTARTVMLQGTGSHVGKSVLATALCSIYAQQGYKVAPFKAQNMALNSAICPDGGEIGRAQAAQARACGLEPSTDMNPILLKPTGEKRAQVIVNGIPMAEMDGEEYRHRRGEMLAAATAALERLLARFDLVIIEGAGSPAEINLRRWDIVNMEVARRFDCPVLLVTDIDRGGAFAAVCGTLDLMFWQDRALVRGVILNKFRGDAGLLSEATAFLEARCGIPVIGVVPWQARVGVEAEDSVSLDVQTLPVEGGADIAVIKLPYISNFTDFSPLAQAGARVRYVSSPEELGTPAAIIIPGTKDTVGDMGFMCRTGLDKAVKDLALAGTPLVGICGGYQMLGETIVESDNPGAQTVKGLRLLPLTTVMVSRKKTALVKGVTADLPPACSALSRLPVEGYEIHHGRTSSGGAHFFASVGSNGDRRSDGACHPTLPMFGTYLHGLFDSAPFRQAFMSWIGVKEVVADGGHSDSFEELRLAVEASVDVEELSKIIFGERVSARRSWPLAPEQDKHGGGGRHGVLDLSENVNRLGPRAEWFATGDLSARASYGRPDPGLNAAAAERYGISRENVVVGAGSAELIYRIISLVRPARVLILGPTFTEYSRAARLGGALVDYFLVEPGESPDFDALAERCRSHDITFVCNPNNPTGALLSPQKLRALAACVAATGLLVVDEAFMDFIAGDAFSVAGLVSELDNLIVLRSLGKLYALPQLRVGLALASPRLVLGLERHAAPWLVGAWAETIAARALADRDFLRMSIEETAASRERLYHELVQGGRLRAYPSAANFLLLRDRAATKESPSLAERLAGRGILARDCSDFPGLGPEFARVSVPTRTEADKLLLAVEEAVLT